MKISISNGSKSPQKPLKIAMIGHKRFGSREGGVEVVVTELSKRMATLGHDVTCFDRSGSDVMTGEAANDVERVEQGVHVVPVKTIDKKGLAALSSSFFATLKAIKMHPDVIHYHAEGPCVPLCLAHLCGIKTVATIHGLDWQRGKWGKLASSYIKLGERIAAKLADELIVLSESAQQYFLDTYERETKLIPNGISEKSIQEAERIRQRWGLEPKGYILFLGRIVPEKCPDLLVRSFREVDTEKRLVIAGAGSDTAGFVDEVRALAEGDNRIVFTGFVAGEELDQLYSNAYMYILPSDVEGMPMSLLEAMAYGRCCITSNIPECANVLDGNGVTFLRGDVGALREAIETVLKNEAMVEKLGREARQHVLTAYSWREIVDETVGLYRGMA